MTKQEIKELLEKQLQILSERSEKCDDAHDLSMLSGNITTVAYMLLDERSGFFDHPNG